jgi:hypothetical protein
MKSSKLGGFALVYALVFAFALAGFIPSLNAQSVELQYPDDDPDVDSRWLPWIGCWELVLETVGHLEEYPEDVLVCLSPVKNESGVRIATWAEGEIILEETLLADGERRPVERSEAEVECRGWQSAKWSADGHRLFLRSEATCGSEIERSNSGVNLLISGPRWIDIQLVRAGDTRELIIRKYRRANERTIAESGAVVPSIAWASAYDWLEAEEPMGLDDIIEASRTIDTEAVEAALMESKLELALGSQSLIRLSDAKVPEEVIDLMVALSYPEDFRIGRLGARKRQSSGSSGGGGGGFGGYGPIYHDDPYAYWYPFFYAPFGYYSYNYRYSPYGGYYRLTPSGGGEITDATHGRVVAGKGYSRVWPRERQSSGGAGRGGGYSSGDGYSQGSGSGGSVSQSGYSGGGSSSSRTAKPKK